MLLLFLAAATVPVTWYYVFIRKPLNHTDKPSADCEIKIIFLAVRQSRRVAGFFLICINIRYTRARTRTIRTTQNNITRISIIGGVNQS